MTTGAFVEMLHLGDGGPPVSRIGLGMAALGRPGYLNVGHGDDLDDRSVDGMEVHAHHVLDHARDRGIRYVDAARSYGRAEDFLAAWLARDPAGPGITVGSKWGYTYTAGWQVDVDVHEVKDHSLATFRRQWAETRHRLGDHVDLYQVHSATQSSGILDDVEVLAALAELAETGVVVGLSLSGSGQSATLARALDLAEAGRAPFRCVQATWNLLEPSVGPMLLRAADAGWGVICKEVVANGRLTDRGDPPAVLAALAGDLDVTVDAVAIAAALAQPFTSVVLSGAVTVAQLEDNLSALDLELTPAVLDDLVDVAEPAADYWAARDDLAWT